MAEMTDTQVALMASVESFASSTDATTVMQRADRFLKWLEENRHRS